MYYYVLDIYWHEYWHGSSWMDKKHFPCDKKYIYSGVTLSIKTRLKENLKPFVMVKLGIYRLIILYNGPIYGHIL